MCTKLEFETFKSTVPMLNKRLEKTEGAIMNGQHRKTGNSGHTRHKKKKKTTTTKNKTKNHTHDTENENDKHTDRKLKR